MTTLPLPPLVGTRKRAQTLVDALGDVEGIDVVVDCRKLVAATESFADELVTVILVRGKASEMHVVNVSDLDFANWVDDRAAVHEVAERVKVDRRPS